MTHRQPQTTQPSAIALTEAYAQGYELGLRQHPSAVPQVIKTIAQRVVSHLDDARHGFTPAMGRDLRAMRDALLAEPEAAPQPAQQPEGLREALQQIADWRLPETGQFWVSDLSRPIRYETLHGSNGARDYMRGVARAALAATPVREAAPDTADEWRRLALQFDGHRMQAIGLLKLIAHTLKGGEKFSAPLIEKDIESFLAAVPLSGEEVLAQRIAALAPVREAAEQPASEYPADLRAQFEAWARPEWTHPEDFDQRIKAPKGTYNSYEVQAAWMGWQAASVALRASRSQPAASFDAWAKDYFGNYAGPVRDLTEKAARKAWDAALAAQGQEAEPVAYLDLGAGGYMDVGTDLTEEQLAALPKGRHMLAIIGTHGVDGYVPRAQADADKRDAERLEFVLRHTPGDALRYVVGELADTADISAFRAAIDAALAGKGGA
ncbi:MAG: hypothetical protein GAK30_02983 [Paracidovorax wautersii]|uniref:Uncharacterized protein n=1 Tax=Paracidovorax wautersii TaxID=1177982 RepID=A0A7V8FLX6_9BURK|nr:MAG: hypothetical protein GAK30_02983 [Paracidovorax wautersii]